MRSKLLSSKIYRRALKKFPPMFYVEGRGCLESRLVSKSLICHSWHVRSPLTDIIAQGATRISLRSVLPDLYLEPLLFSSRRFGSSNSAAINRYGDMCSAYVWTRRNTLAENDIREGEEHENGTAGAPSSLSRRKTFPARRVKRFSHPGREPVDRSLDLCDIARDFLLA